MRCEARREARPGDRREARRTARGLLLVVVCVLVALGAGGCGDVCVRNSDCGDGLVCGASGHCSQPPDAAAGDGGGNGSIDGGAMIDSLGQPDLVGGDLLSSTDLGVAGD